MPAPIVVLAVLLAIAIGLRTAAALAIRTPSLLPDEAAYALLGRGLWHHADLAVLGGPSQYVSALYPVVSALPYDLLRVLQVLALCSTAVVVYLWARELARAPWALTAAALTLVLPGLSYGGAIVAETLLVPLATVSGWLAVRTLVAPTWRNQVFLVAALAASALTRAEANTLVLALLVAALAVRRMRALWPTWAAVVAFVIVWAALGGGSPLRSLGGFEGGTYTAHRVVVWILQDAGSFLLVCGLVPLVAVALLGLQRQLGLRTRATVHFALTLALATVVEVGVFTAGHADRLLERELLFAIPPLFVGFAAWLDRGAPRPRLRTAALAVAGVAALLAMPFGRLATAAAAPDNPTLVPLSHLDSPRVYGVVALFTLGAAVLTLSLPRRLVWLLPALLAAIFAATAVSAAEELVDRSQEARATDTARSAGWIDTAADGPVTYLYDGAHDFRIVWSQLFWNDGIAHVLDLPATHVPGPLAQQQLQVVQDDGALRLVGGSVPAVSYIVAPSSFGFRGSLVARAARLGLSVWHVQSPLQLRTWAQGVLPNGDVPQGGVATLDVFDCGRGTFHLVAVGRDNETVRLNENGNRLASTDLWPDGVWEQRVRTRAAGGRCTFSVTTSSLLHLATFAWTPG